MQVSRDACRIHLSEHHGDGTPGTVIRIEMPAEGDPFGNRLTFYRSLRRAE
jgi:hypothetical protein